jgi:hypothetical protein
MQFKKLNSISIKAMTTSLLENIVVFCQNWSKEENSTFLEVSNRSYFRIKRKGLLYRRARYKHGGTMMG